MKQTIDYLSSILDYHQDLTVDIVDIVDIVDTGHSGEVHVGARGISCNHATNNPSILLAETIQLPATQTGQKVKPVSFSYSADQSEIELAPPW